MEENLPNTEVQLPAKSPRRIWFKRIALSLLGILLSMIAAAVVIVTVYEDEIVRYALESFQKNIKTKSEVKEADLTLWENFPLVSIRLKNVYIEEDAKRKDTLIYANELLFSFDIIDVFSGKYNIDEVGLKGGKCNFKIDKRGRENWNVWVEDTVASTNDKFSVKIEKIFAKDAEVVVENEAERSFYDIGFKSLDAAGKFSEEMFMLDLESNGVIHSVFAGSTDLLNNKRFDIDSKLDVNLKQQALHLAKTELTIQEVPLVLAGSIRFGKNPSVDLDVEKTELDLEEGIRLLPAQFQVQLKPYEPSGHATFNFSMHGEFSKLKIASDFTVNEGSLKEINSGVALSDINFQAAYRLENDKDSIQVQACSATLGTGKFNGTGTIRNLAKPHLNLNVQLQSNLQELKGFLGWDSIATAAGDVNLQAAISGGIAFSEVDSTFDWSLINVNGNAAFANASFQVTGSDVKFTNINGTFGMNGSDARVDNLNFSLNNNQVLLSGDLLQFVPYLTTDYRTMEIRANFYSHRLDMNTLLSEGGQQEVPMAFPNRMNIRVNAQIDEFLYKNFKASQIQGVIYCANKALSVNPLNMTVAGGTVSADFNLYPNASKRYTMTSTATLKHIQIDNVFVLFDDFGQSYLTKNNIKGSTDAQLYYYSELDEQFVVMPETIEAEANVRIENGELNDVESLQYLTEYLKGNKWIAPFVKEDVFAEKLRHVKFSTLENTISIKNSVITFPLMDIESSAMDISIEGSHTFSNYLDYRFGFDLKDILLSQNSEKNGRQLFLYMKGPIDNLEFGLDKEALRSDRVSSREKQRSKLRQLFNGEISIRNNDGNGGLRQLFNKPTSLAVEPSVVTTNEVVQPSAPTKAPREKKTPTWLQEKNEYEEEE